MDKHRKSSENTDAEETMFFQSPASSHGSDAYDTQQMDRSQIRRQAAQTGTSYGQGGYSNGQSGYPNRQNGYPYQQGGYSSGQNGYPNRQSGYVGRQNSHPNGQNGYASRQNSYSNGRNGYVNRQNGHAGGAGRTPHPSAGGYDRERSAAPRRTSQPGSPYAAPGDRRRTVPQRPPQPSGSRRPAVDQPASNRTRQAEPARRPTSQKKRRRGGSLLGKVVKSILCLIVAVFVLYSVIAMVGILGMQRVETGSRSFTSGSLDVSYVKSVLVIGTDTRDPEVERGRSDSMILVSMNSRTREIYMTSFMRDAYVDIPGNGSGKLNAAYSYGGPELLMDTIESNYQVHIDDYVMVTFSATAAMIDAVGGVELTISDEEAQAVNEILISEVNEIMGDGREDDLLDGGGTLTLSGKQALSYSRIRYVGNADFERTERQRTVMQQVMEKVKSNPLRLVTVCLSALPEMTTNLSVGSLYGYAVTTPLKLVMYDMQQQRIPADGMYSGANIGGESVLQVDFEAAQQLLQDTVYAE